MSTSIAKEVFLSSTLQPGEYYSGIVLGKGRTRDYHLVLTINKLDNVNWEAAMAFAEGVEAGRLPNRQESLLLAANLSSVFEGNKLYWTGETHSADHNVAWAQSFFNGGQVGRGKETEHNCVVIRRVIITEAGKEINERRNRSDRRKRTQQ